ncbi:MAG: sodium:solute symporter [Bacteroidales bacterium]|nr:sodium:solute symporter [Bacteroidales bacterium]
MNGAWILVILLGYFGLLMLISALVGKQKGNNGFFTGNKKSPWYVVSIGMIGTSISGITFVSVPGMVRDNGFLYMQTVAGFFVGYILIAKILLPLYYRLNAPSIYVYLKERFGSRAYKTGAWFFLISKAISASIRVYVAALILHESIFSGWNVPFGVTVIALILMIWLYTFRGGIKTIVWVDVLQSLCMIGALVLILFQLGKTMNLDVAGMVKTVGSSKYFNLVEWSDWGSRQHLFKQFFSGIFIALVMTGLDQGMIQKNRTINKLEKAQKNMYYYGFAFIPVNFIFLSLGTLMYIFASQKGIILPDSSDEVLPMLATQDYLNTTVTVLFMIGIVSAAFSSADTAMTAMTTSFCVDILEKENDVKTRQKVHLFMAMLFIVIIFIFRAANSTTLIDAIYVMVSYTYGPLLGLYGFGLFTKKVANDWYIPIIAVSSPILCYLLQVFSNRYFGYQFGYELLMLNGLLTFCGLWFSSLKKSVHGNQ